MTEENLRRKVRVKAIVCACLLALCVYAGIFAAEIKVSAAAECGTIRAAGVAII